MRTYALTIALALLVSVPAGAQDAPLGDARWAPWLGCWRLIQDDPGALAAVTTNSEDVLVCVLSASAGRGVDMTTYVGGQSVVQQTILADGTSHPVREPECSGSQRSEWSLTGQRLFTSADLTCSSQPVRTVSGITLMTEGPIWIDIQAVGTDQDPQVRVRRYERTSSPPDGAVLPADVQRRAVAATARFAGPTPMTLAEVVEASGKIATPAVEAALLETGVRVDLNSRALRELDAAGVPDGVVDVMVALSFPGHVTIDRPRRGRATQTQGATAASVRRSNRRPDDSSSPYYPYTRYNPYYPYNPYGAYGWYSPYSFYYSPFGYSNWWGNPYQPYYFRSPRPVVVVPGGSTRPSGNRGGQVIQGRGYTQGRAAGVQDAPRTDRGAVAEEERSPNSGAASGASSRRAVSRRGYSSGGSSSGAGSSSGGGSISSRGTGSSGSGSSSGGSGSRSGRTAQPR